MAGGMLGPQRGPVGFVHQRHGAGCSSCGATMLRVNCSMARRGDSVVQG